MKKFIAVLLGFICLVSCQKEAVGDIVGVWKLDSDILNVEVEFTPDGNFRLTQVLFDGLTQTFTGKYVFVKNTLSGTYSDGTAFANTYKVIFHGNSMILSSEAEQYTYNKLL